MNETRDRLGRRLDSSVWKTAQHSRALEQALLSCGITTFRERMLDQVARCREMLELEVPCGNWAYTAVHHFSRRPRWHDVAETRDLFDEYVSRGLIRLDEPIVNTHEVDHGYAEGTPPLAAALLSANEGAFFAFLDAGANPLLLGGPSVTEVKAQDIVELAQLLVPSPLTQEFTARLTEHLIRRQVRDLVDSTEPAEHRAPQRRRHTL